jgi:peptidoglycan/LPS O-acetylase OafA/YrhL
VPLTGGAVFGYRRRSFWWAVVAVVAGWLVFAVLTVVMDGWDVGPGQDIVATVFLSVYLAGATLIGGVLGKYLASRPNSP